MRKKVEKTALSGVPDSPTDKLPKNPSVRSDVYSFYPWRVADIDDREKNEDDPTLKMVDDYLRRSQKYTEDQVSRIEKDSPSPPPNIPSVGEVRTVIWKPPKKIDSSKRIKHASVNLNWDA